MRHKFDDREKDPIFQGLTQLYYKDGERVGKGTNHVIEDLYYISPLGITYIDNDVYYGFDYSFL